MARGISNKICPTVIGAPLPPTAFSWPEARLTPAREAPAIVTEQI